MADTAATLLRACGFEAEACYSGRDALRRFPGYRPDACLVDLNMPVMDGCELAARLRVEYDGSPRLVAVTARHGEDDRRRTAAAGFDDHLVKPVAPTPARRLSNPRPAGDPLSLLPKAVVMLGYWPVIKEAGSQWNEDKAPAWGPRWRTTRSSPWPRCWLSPSASPASASGGRRRRVKSRSRSNT